MLRKKGDYQYVLSKYVNISFWMNNLKKHFQNVYIENLTDFNYSTCFTMYLNISNTNAKVGTEEFRNFVRQNVNFYRLKIQISAIAPYAIYKFVKYTFNNNKIMLSESFIPYNNEQYIMSKNIAEFLSKSGLIILDKEILSVKVSGISLEMKKSDITVYNCLFEDGY